MKPNDVSIQPPHEQPPPPSSDSSIPLAGMVLIQQLGRSRDQPDSFPLLRFHIRVTGLTLKIKLLADAEYDPQLAVGSEIGRILPLANSNTFGET